MRHSKEDFGFYGIITDPLVGYETLARIMVEHSVRFIQLRMKKESKEEVFEMARALRKVVGGDSLFIVNDYPEIAAEVGADGVHLGQDDAPYREARKLLGKEAIIGLSTHNPTQTQNACALAPDYIGVGPVYATPTKKNPDPVIGLSGMKEMLSVASCPAVVLGGIDHGNCGDVLGAGAQNISAVRCINQSPDPAAELDKMIKAIEVHRVR